MSTQKIGQPHFNRPFTIKPAANGIIIEPQREVGKAYNEESSYLFVEVEEFQSFIVDLINGDVEL